MPGLLEPGVACKLLLTAAVRKHTAAVQHMVGLASMRQHINAVALEAMLKQLLKQEQCLSALCRLPAAAQLTTDAGTRLLLAAIQQSTFRVVRQLHSLAAAQQLSTEQAETLLQACMQEFAGTHDSVSSVAYDRAFDIFLEVIDLPAAILLSSSALVQLLHTAADMADPDITDELCILPAAAAVSSEDAVGLLPAVLQKPSSYHVDETIIILMELPAFSQLSCAAVAQLMHAAAEHYIVSTLHPAMINSHTCLKMLCELPAAQELSAEQLLQLLKLVVAHSKNCTEHLCKLPAGQQLSSEAVTELLLAAAASSGLADVEQLLTLAAAKQTSSEVVAQL
jgi:hypothetical protein